jgi:glycosyltransferase involved in cell wall biosynthesis
MWKSWTTKARKEGLEVRVGRWNIPGQPCVILVAFDKYFEMRDQLYGNLWDYAKVDSMNGYGDYDEANMFSYAAGLVVESFYRHSLEKTCKNVVYQAHEWMTCLGAMYIQQNVPAIATIFTTHATTIGRSIAGNNKPLYDYLWAYNGIQMSKELNVEAKHSIERETAHRVDCFTTVSDVTAQECEELMDKKCHTVLPNGFESDFVPKAAEFKRKRKIARDKIFQMANCLTGCEFSDDTLIIGTSGRYEFRNKGIDVFIEAMNRLGRDKNLQKPVLALVEVPAWVGDPREDLVERINSNEVYTTPLECPVITHWLHDMSHDNVTGMMKYNDMWNRPEDKVKLIFIPCYLDGKDGVINLSYYDTIIGKDLSVYPSYYEPWGYTPLESVAFHVPCVTTSLSGFGMWANKVKGSNSTIMDGVEVIRRTDYNYSEVADRIKETVSDYSQLTEKEVDDVRKKAKKLSDKALWKHFIKHYYEAYDIALKNRDLRVAAK